LDYPFQTFHLISTVTKVTAIIEAPVAIFLTDDLTDQQAPFVIMQRSAKGRCIFILNEPILFEMLSDAEFSTVGRLIRHGTEPCTPHESQQTASGGPS